MDSIATERFVKDLKNYRFVVPSYQRGYKWDQQQVSELLDDIYEFFDNAERTADENYCLQPVVVKKLNEEKTFEVIDGQQRLTTIYIILKYAYRNDDEEELPYSISYETRPDSESFLERSLGEISLEDCQNPDFYFMQQAWNTIVAWREKNGLSSKEFDRMIASHVEARTLLIWYQIADDQDAISMFRKLNVGKIPLTNAELIKGKLLGDLKKQCGERRMLSVADEWNHIEQSLQNDRLWFFLTNDENIDLMQSTRIDLLFSIWENSKSKISGSWVKKNAYSSFNCLCQMVKEGAQVLDVWRDICDIFAHFQYWYTDNVMYHKIGYLIASGFKSAEELIPLLVDKKKSEVKMQLDGLIRESLVSTECDTFEKIKLLDYNDPKEKAAIKRVLLLFNIKTILDSDRASIRFPFEKYKTDDWDIEHIHATASKPPTDAEIDGRAEKRRRYFESLKTIADDYGIDAQEMKAAIDSFIDDSGYEDEGRSDYFASSEAFVAFYAAIEEQQNLISNLALLDADTNRSYGSGTFLTKRDVIIKKDRSAEFVPICTKNVFLKYYTQNPQSFAIWSATDRREYLNGKNGMMDTLAYYLDGDDDE